jgi:hypothetical protein
LGVGFVESLLLLVVSGVCLWGCIWLFHPDARRARAFSLKLRERSAVSDSEFRFHFDRTEVQTDVPCKVWLIFAVVLGYPAEKLLPDDDFAFALNDVDNWPLIEALEREFGVTFTDDEVAQTAPTIRAVCLLLTEKARGETIP